MPLAPVKLVTRSRAEMAAELPRCWRVLRLAGYSRTRLLWSFGRAWARGDIRIDSTAPFPSVIYSRKGSR